MIKPVEARKDNTFKIPVAGHIKDLQCSVGIFHCGKITDGISFEFGNEGGWVISFSDLKEIVAEAELVRSNVG